MRIPTLKEVEEGAVAFGITAGTVMFMARMFARDAFTTVREVKVAFMAVFLAARVAEPALEEAAKVVERAVETLE